MFTVPLSIYIKKNHLSVADPGLSVQNGSYYPPTPTPQAHKSSYPMMVETWSSLSPTRLITGAGGGFSSGTVSVSILLSSPSTEGTSVGAAHDTAPQVAGYRLYNNNKTGRLVNTYEPPLSPKAV